MTVGALDWRIDWKMEELLSSSRESLVEKGGDAKRGKFEKVTGGSLFIG